MSRNPRFNRGFAGWIAAWFVTVSLPPWSAPAAMTNALFATTPAEPPRVEVAVVRDANASQAFQPDPTRVRAMVDRALTTLTGEGTVAAAWRVFVSPQDVVGLKVVSALGPTSGTRPAVVAAVIEGLLEAGLPPPRIVIWDKDLGDLRYSGYPELGRRYGVRVEASVRAGFDPEVFYDVPLLGTLMWGDSEFGMKGEGVGRKSYVSKLITQELTKIINLTPLLNHPAAGVSGNLYGLAMGSVDNTWRFEGDPARLAQAVPEICALPALYDRVALSIVDALLCQYQGSQRGLLHYSAVLNEIRVSRDPVALDVLSLQELDCQRESTGVATGKVNFQLYQNASLLELGVSDPQRIHVVRLP